MMDAVIAGGRHQHGRVASAAIWRSYPSLTDGAPSAPTLEHMAAARKHRGSNRERGLICAEK